MYAMVAAGLALMLGVARLINFAHGEFFMLGAYILFFATAQASVPYPITVLLCVVGMAAFGAVFDKVVYEPVIKRRWSAQLVATLAASVILSNAAIVLFGGTQRGAPTSFSNQTLVIGSVHVSYQRVLAIVVTLLAFFLLDQFVTRTHVGRAMRGVSQNREAAEVLGIDIRFIALVTFALSAGLAGLAAALVAPLQTISPTTKNGASAITRELEVPQRRMTTSARQFGGSSFAPTSLIFLLSPTSSAKSRRGRRIRRRTHYASPR